VDGSEVDVARIPWVLAVPAGNPRNLRALGDIAQTSLDVWVLGGPAAYEARRALGSLAPERVKEATDATLLRAAAVALVPLSLAGSGERIPVDVPPLVARAAVAVRSTRTTAAQEFVRFLASEAGQRAFTACGSR
jgi:accessory colonization factor AcfC